MIQQLVSRYIVKHISKYPSCGRDPCYCLMYFNLNDKNEKQFYLDCYETKLNFKHKEDHLINKSNKLDK